jgi:hypothetical protein
MKKLKLITLILSACLLITFTGIVYAANSDPAVNNGTSTPYSDVPGDYWANDEILYFTQQGIVQGMGNGSFAPNLLITREQFAVMLVGTFSQPLINPAAATFVDVSRGRWSYSFVETSKNFLSGYSSPFGGKPSFRPDEPAVREDMVLALVRMMGLTDKDVSDINYAYIFKDADKISPSLLPYVSLAVERGLIKGYEDGTFRPQGNITRAEAVALLYQATKQAVININAELELYVNTVTGNDPKEVFLMIRTEEGASVTVDGQSVKMESDYGGWYTGTFEHKFTKEGVKNFTVKATKAGKEKSIKVTAEYEIDTPIFDITNCPSSVTSKEVTLAGTLKDSNYGVSLKINNKPVNVDKSGNWQKSFKLTDLGTNVFNFVASNDAGKTVTVTKEIFYSIGDPILDITQCPSSVTTREVTIKGTLKDNDFGVFLMINGKPVSVDKAGNWQKNFVLDEGDNDFKFSASNDAGGTMTLYRTIKYTVGDPILDITYCPSSVTTKEVTIRGTLKDSDYGVSLMVNGKPVSVDKSGNWQKNFILDKEYNSFNFVASNDAGKITTYNRTIRLEVGSPTITFINCPKTAKQKNITIIGTVGGETEGLYLFVNDLEWKVSGNEFKQNVTLEDGDNEFVFRAVNGFGKEISITKNIEYGVSGAE